MGSAAQVKSTTSAPLYRSARGLVCMGSSAIFLKPSLFAHPLLQEDAALAPRQATGLPGPEQRFCLQGLADPAWD